MIKQWALLGGLAIFSLQTQAQAFEGKIKSGKSEEPAIVMAYNYPLQIVSNAFAAKFADKQLLAAENKDFKFFPNAIISEISKSKLDYYFKIEPTTKEKTTVYIIMHGSGDIEGVNDLASRSKLFLQGMEADVLRSNTIALIKRQETALVDEEKILSDLQTTQQELEAKLQENQSKQAAQQKIIASQKAILDDLKTKTN